MARASGAADRLQSDWATRRIALVFAGLSILVAISTLAFTAVTGYGTRLFQLIIFTSLALLAKATSFVYADTHYGSALAIAAALNVIVFWLVAVPLWGLSRRRTPLIGMAALIFYAAFYIASLFWLFPATDGP